MREEAIFAAGCFWGVEADFRALPGVLDARVGYTGGDVPHPTYEQVCGGKTGHAEGVKVVFDPEKVTYETLVRKFFELHDPTTPNRQGPDIGHQYRSAIFTLSESQAETARRVRDELEVEGRFPSPIVTEIEPAREFWEAEEYHQRYLEKRGRNVCG
jgi:peptide-methionine (S)-S-oxide reductase